MQTILGETQHHEKYLTDRDAAKRQKNAANTRQKTASQHNPEKSCYIVYCHIYLLLKKVTVFSKGPKLAYHLVQPPYNLIQLYNQV